MKYGLIGEKLGHSFSKDIHKMLLTGDYTPVELTQSELDVFLKKMDFSAINVTIPYKQAVIPYLHYIDENARNIGAVNTVVNKDGLLYGYNTDFYGLSVLVKKTAGDITNKKVIILGSGGTSRTAYAVAKSLGAAEIYRVSRTGKDGSVTYDYMYENLLDADVVINTTPVGMYPECEKSPLCLEKFIRLSAVVDVIFNPISTVLVLDAREKGISAEGGLYMLVAQAVAASEHFASVTYPADTVDNIYRKILNSKQNIVLTGMPGSGKSTVGKILAESMGRQLYDIDSEIVSYTGMEITQIFARYGEAGFRDIETEITKKLSALSGVIISCGGGTVLRDENINALRRNGVIFFIDRPLSQLIPTADRPLASDVEAIKTRYNERIDRYISTCDVRIPVEGDAQTVAVRIRKEFLSETTCNKRTQS